MLALEGQGLTRRYGGFTALDSVAIELGKGVIRGLIGPNGAGKSTLIDTLSGRSRGATGSVRLGALDISTASPQKRRRLGLARSFQKISIFPDMTVAEQLDVAARLTPDHGMEDVVEGLDLRDHLGERAGNISYGHQRRLDLALALVGRPSVLLLDEPSAGLTVAESLVLARTLRSLAQERDVSVLIVEHDMEVIFSICDELTVLHLGKVLAEGRPTDIRKDERVIKAYLGSAA